MSTSDLYVFGAFRRGHYIHPAPPSDVWHMRDACDTPPSGVVQIEGEIACAGVPVAGWSFVSWWDRQGDPRAGSHTGILARGTWEPWQLVAEGRRRYPWAFRVELGKWALPPAVAPLRAHNARMAACLLKVADACDVLAIPSNPDATRHTLAEALPGGKTGNWQDIAVALRRLAGGVE